MDNIPTCQYLALIPSDIDKLFLERQAKRLAEGRDDDLASFIAQIRKSAGFEPYCTKLKTYCVVMESPVIAQATGQRAQSLGMTMHNSKRIPDCEDRLAEENHSDGFVDIFLANHVMNAYR